MSRAPLLLNGGRIARLVSADDEVLAAFRVVREASGRMRAIGVPHWKDDEYSLEALFASRDRKELAGAFDRAGLRATMQVQMADPEFWPGDTAGDAAYLHKLAVAPRAAGGGWADLLLRWADLLARERRVRFLRLDTVPGPLVDYYRQRGFRDVEAWPSARLGRPVVKMQRELGG